MQQRLVQSSEKLHERCLQENEKLHGESYNQVLLLTSSTHLPSYCLRDCVL